MNPEYGIDCYRSRVRGPYARFCEKDKGPANYWALALLDLGQGLVALAKKKTREIPGPVTREIGKF